MHQNGKFSLPSIALAISFCGLPSHAAMMKCVNFVSGLSGPELTQELQWRNAITHTRSQAAFAATNTEREAWIKELQVFMENYIFTAKDTPEMEFVPAVGINLKVLQDYDNGRIPRISLTGIGPDGILAATMLLPVSGHCGPNSARAWAKTDTYSLFLESPAGNINIVKDAPSLGIITLQEIEVKLTPSVVYKITYHRSGSGGPMGYPSGRILEIVWDGT